ncbi:hypothetical protein [Mesorhizobium sp. M0701]|uniref:hypothetical protein n=1 Tax=Mesorhizobium sp. M0701 TaxID=2956989 RepID=UPI00333CE1EC
MAAEKPKLTEPEIIAGTFCTFVDVDVRDEFVRLTGCDEVPLVGYDGPELRIVDRIVVPRATARRLLTDLQRALGRRDR